MSDYDSEYPCSALGDYSNCPYRHKCEYADACAGLELLLLLEKHQNEEGSERG